MPSEVAELRKRIDDEYHSMMLRLSGNSITTRHDFIQARMNVIDQYREELAKVVGEERSLDIVMEINDRVVGKFQKLVQPSLQKKHIGKSVLYRTGRRVFL